MYLILFTIINIIVVIIIIEFDVIGIINKLRARKTSNFVSIPGGGNILPFSQTKRRDGLSQKLMLNSTGEQESLYRKSGVCIAKLLWLSC